jgi:hypothetical protein
MTLILAPDMRKVVITRWGRDRKEAKLTEL